jgi:hypothetical protein
MRYKKSCVLILGVAGAISAGLVNQLKADTLYDSGGFETAAGYSVGSLAGQPSGASAADQWQQSSAGAIQASVFQYQSSTQQGVVIADSATANSYGYWYPGTYVSSPFSPGSGDVNISWTEYYDAGTGNPFYGVVVFDGANTVAQVGVDTTDNDFVIADGTGTYETPTYTETPGTYFNLEIVLHYGAQDFDIYENGSKLNATPLPFANAATEFTDADLTSYQALGASDFSGDGYFDNYVVTYVPEPTSVALIAGVISLGLIRRRSRTSGPFLLKLRSFC